MGKLSRTKGAANERDFVTLARRAGFGSAFRTAPLQAGEREDDTGRKRYPDVDGVSFLWCENKHEARCSPKAYARKYLYDEKPGRVPVVFWRENGMGPERTIAETLATDLLKIVRELSDLREENARLRHAACPAPVKHVLVDEVGAYPTDGEPEPQRCKYGALVCTHSQCHGKEGKAA
jgi:hypothetical protein